MTSLRKLFIGASTAVLLASVPVSAAHAAGAGGGKSWFAIISGFFAGQIDPFAGQIDPFAGQIDPF